VAREGLEVALPELPQQPGRPSRLSRPTGKALLSPSSAGTDGTGPFAKGSFGFEKMARHQGLELGIGDGSSVPVDYPRLGTEAVRDRERRQGPPRQAAQASGALLWWRSVSPHAYP
jgi:hypothetical protein